MKDADDDVVPIDAIPLLPPERGGDATLMAAVNEWCAKRESTFAGLVWSRDALYVGFVRDMPRNLRELRAAFPGLKVRAFAAGNNYLLLRSTVDRITKDLPALRQMGVQIWAVGIDPSRNAVIITLPADSFNVASRELPARYGSGLLLFEVGSTRQLVRNPSDPSVDPRGRSGRRSSV